MHLRQHLPLRLVVEVDHHVAHEHEVEGRPRGHGVDEVVPLEPDHPTDRLLDLPLHARPREVPHEEVRREPPVHLQLTVAPATRTVEHRSRRCRCRGSTAATSSSSGKCSRIDIARLYGSWPVEHPADQMASVRVRSLRSSSSGSTTGAQRFERVEVAEERRLVRRQRVHDLVVQRRRELAVRSFPTSSATTGQPWSRATGSSRDSARYSLPGSSTMAARTCISSRR